MKLIIMGLFMTLMALGISCAQVSQSVAEVALQGTSDGIKVHGDWTVTVTNPGGTVNTVYEFENALGNRGADLLTLLLSDQTPGPITWVINVTDKISSSYSENLDCEESIYNGPFLENWLPAVQHRDSSLNGSPLRFAATCTVSGMPNDDTSSLHKVNTIAFLDTGYSFFEDKDNGAKSHQCNNMYSDPLLSGKCTWANFTYHKLEPSIPLANGQLLSFNVVISFE